MSKLLTTPQNRTDTVQGMKVRLSQGQTAAAVVIVIPLGSSSVMAELGQSKATLSAVAIRVLVPLG